jgi:erythronate-4-phosphate dehydrogenase
MQIVVDKDIYGVGQYFGTLGEVVKVDGRNLGYADVRHADMLIVRSITTVDARLLRGSRVRFVGSVTSGTDHIDFDFLRDHGIGFASAPGCNARAVAEYVLSSLMVLTEQRDSDITGRTAAIVGCGHVGSLVREFLQVLGLRVLVNDPPLRDAGDARHTTELESIGEADIISLHVPLTHTGPYPTRLLVDDTFLQRLRPDVIFINTSRGGVVDENAALDFLNFHEHAGMILDVWQDEPDINPELLRRVAIGTAHIAGHTLDSRIRAVEMVYREACSSLQKTPVPSAGAEHDIDYQAAEIPIAGGTGDLDAVRMAVLTSYDVRTDSGALRKILDLEPGRRCRYFDELRSGYRIRREFSSLRVSLPSAAGALAEKLGRLGFGVTVQT